jgi:Undecaprenyl-phosphate glucose phosphotransferase
VSVESIDEKRGGVLGEATVSLKRKPGKPVSGSSKVNESYSLNRAAGLMALSDILILLSTGITICWYHLGWVSAGNWFYAFAILAPSVTVVLAFYQAGLYDVGSICKPLSQVPKLMGILVVTLLSYLALAFALKISNQFSRVWFFSWFVSSAFLVILARELLRSLFGRWGQTGQLSRKIVVFGSGDQAERCIEKLMRSKEPWLSIIGIFDDRKKRSGPSVLGFPVLGTLDDLLGYVRRNHVDDIVVALPWSAEHRISEISRKLSEVPVHIRLGFDLAGFQSLHSSYSFIGGVPMLHLVNKPLDGWKYVVKELEDKIVSFFLLVSFSPLLLLIALAIKLESKGPVMFRQSRKGFNGKQFSVFKFRTMVHDRPQDIGSAQATSNDPRVTAVGKFLRRTSLDELPQFLNVLSGSMSLVGPRPHPLALDDEFCNIIGGYFARHRVKPGITGWAQVNGFRGETSTPDKMQARVEHDMHYIEHWSLLFDVKILLMTALVAANQKNAY